VIGTAYRFKVRQTYNEFPFNSSWSDFKIVATLMEPELLKYEYVEIYARGTGARNHNTSVVKVDNNTLLDHGLYRGLHLIVLSRKNLKKVFNATYDLMLKEKSFPMNKIYTDITSRCQNFTLVDTLNIRDLDRNNPNPDSNANNVNDNGTASEDRYDLGWTILVKKAEFETVIPIDKNLTNLRNGTFTQYRTVVAY